MSVCQAVTEPPSRRIPVRRLFDVPIAAVTMADALSLVDEAIARRGSLLIGAVNAAKVVNMRRDAGLRTAVLRSDLILADGMAVVWAARLLGVGVPERVSGIDLMYGMLDRGRQRGYRVYCLGASEAVLADVTARIPAAYPGVVVCGAHHGYFGDKDEPVIVEAIRAARPDILLVAMSPPKKELFLARWAEHLGVPVMHGVGGAFDVLAGKVRRAPGGWQRWGLEWLYRVIQEPRRMWRRYLVTNTLFCTMVLVELLRPRR